MKSGAIRSLIIFLIGIALSLQFNSSFAQVDENSAFPFRSMHLDVSRHFFEVEVVEQFIDSLSAHNYNYFHFHLTDDQGWRIEIKSFPLLTEIGAYRTTLSGETYGGFYTQDEIRHLVDYANKRNVQIIPEIDFPGHTSSAITAYPWLSCHGRQIDIPSRHGIYNNVLCPTDTARQFILAVLDEVCDLFPGPYVHIGGDEVPKKQWKKHAPTKELLKDLSLNSYQALQNHWMNEAADFLEQRGKSVIVWGEVTHSEFDRDLIIMSWRGKKAGIKAAKQGNRVVMTSRFYTYFDYPESRKQKKPVFYYPYLKDEKVAEYDLYSKKLSDEENANIIGGGGMLWTEFIPNAEKLWEQFSPRVSTLGRVLKTKCRFGCMEK